MRNQIIRLLRNQDGYFSGEEISKQLKLSRAAIWKNIEELRKEGYVIDAVPHKGYQLKSVPEKLIEREIQFQLNNKIIGNKIACFNEVTSTMEHAFRLAVDGEEEGTVVCAETQTKGKGRLGRSWVSPKETGIYMSVILRPKATPSSVAQLTLLAAVAVCEAIREVSSVQATIKWPNDILFEGQKLAGILTEISAEMDKVNFLVIGIGINVNTPANVLPDNGTSIKKILKKKIARTALVQKVLENMEREYLIFEKEGTLPIINKWKTLTSTLGSKVCLSDQNGEIKGKAVDLDEFGGLMIEQDNGVVIKRMSGDVVEVS